MILTRFLERAGIRVWVADNGAEGVDKVLWAQGRDEPFDLILMDMMMPVLDGYGAARRLRDTGISTPIIALTALAMTEDRDRILAAGCDSYLSKPFKPDQLYAAISKQLLDD